MKRYNIGNGIIYVFPLVCGCVSSSTIEKLLGFKNYGFSLYYSFGCTKW